jgi:hypothetical protein
VIFDVFSVKILGNPIYVVYTQQGLNKDKNWGGGVKNDVEALV